MCVTAGVGGEAEEVALSRIKLLVTDQRQNLRSSCYRFQDFCEHGEQWPPLKEMHLVLGSNGNSCKEACGKRGKMKFTQVCLSLMFFVMAF